jgi:hypothetical protein
VYAVGAESRHGGSRLSVIGAAAILVTAFGFLALRGADDKTGLSQLYLLGLVQASPMVIAFARRRFSYLDFCLFNHFFVFTVARLNLSMNLENQEALPPEIMPAIKELLYCTVLMILGNVIARSFFFRRYFEEADYEKLTLTPARHGIILTMVLLFPFAHPYLPPSVVIPIFAASSAFFVLLFTSTVPGSSRRETWGRVLLFGSAAHYFFETGFMTLLGQFVGVYFILICLTRKVKQFYVLVVIVLAISVVQTVKADFREFLMVTPDATLSERADIVGGLIEERYLSSDADEEYRQRQVAKGFSRVGDNSLETVLAQTPSIVPFWEGATYATIPFMFIPRFVWPEKPARDFWNRYGRLYGILSEDDRDTSVGVGFLAEAYMNYGFVGLYLMSLAFGFFVAVIERISVFFMGTPTVMTFVIFLMPLLPYSTDLGSMLNSLFVSACVVTASRWLVGQAANRDAYGTGTA